MNDISFDEIMQIPQLKNLHETEQFKELKTLAYNAKKRGERVTIDQLFHLPHHDRFNQPTKGGVNPTWRDRLLLKAKKIHKKFISKVRLDTDLVKPKTKRVMTFEVSHLDALRCESAMCVNFEVYRKQNQIEKWPKTSNPDLFMKFGWIVFWIQWSTGVVFITEIQSPVEMINVTHDGHKHHFIEPPNWSSFMLQQFLQYMMLRGFRTFTLPSVEIRKSHVVEGVGFIESNYRDLPKAFGFTRKEDGWWGLNF
jgi:hypothetical protein